MFRTRPHVLFFTEKWCNFVPSGGLTNSFHNLFTSLNSSGLATCNLCFYDEVGTDLYKCFYRSLFETCPDVIFTSLNGRHLTDFQNLLSKAKEYSNCAIVNWSTDTVDNNVLGMVAAVFPFASLHVIADGSYITAPKFLSVGAPQDVAVYDNPEYTRDIDVCFAGSKIAGPPSYKPRRAEVLESLKDSGFSIYQVGGQREGRLSALEYSSVFKRSKIALNIRSGIDSGKVTGRVFEATLCGAMLLSDSSNNNDVSTFFIPDVDYVLYRETEDLKDKIKYYLSRPAERFRVASSGYQKSLALHNSTSYWDMVFKYLKEV